MIFFRSYIFKFECFGNVQISCRLFSNLIIIVIWPVYNESSTVRLAVTRRHVAWHPEQFTRQFRQPSVTPWYAWNGYYSISHSLIAR